MIKRAFLKLAGTTALALTLGTGAFAQEVTLRMHQFLPAQANVPKNVLVPWADRVMEASGGRIEIQHFPSMQLGGTPPQLIDQAIDGVADIIWTVAGYTPGRFPRAEVFELPFTMTDAGDMSAAYWELAEEQMMDQDFADFKVLGVWVHGPGVIHSADPIEVPGDLNGVKLRAPTRVTNKLFTNLGATTVCAVFNQNGIKVLTGGTDSHIILIDLSESKHSGREAADLLEANGITVNKNGVPNDPRSFVETSGIRIGTAAETTRGHDKEWFNNLALRICQILNGQ